MGNGIVANSSSLSGIVTKANQQIEQKNKELTKAKQEHEAFLKRSAEEILPLTHILAELFQPLAGLLVQGRYYHPQRTAVHVVYDLNKDHHREHTKNKVEIVIVNSKGKPVQKVDGTRFYIEGTKVGPWITGPFNTERGEMDYTLEQAVEYATESVKKIMVVR